jgi:hypothetical protein
MELGSPAYPVHTTQCLAGFPRIALSGIVEVGMKVRIAIVWLAILVMITARGAGAAPAPAPGRDQTPQEAACAPVLIQTASPNRASVNQINSLAAPGANDVWAVGGVYTQTHNTFVPLIEHWDGAQWSQVSQPVTTSAQLKAVAAVNTSDVWAVGTEGDIVTPLLTEHWDGRQWTVVPAPDLGEPSNTGSLSGVAAIASNDAWAVGSTNQVGSTALTIHWDGTQWTQVLAPSAVLSAVAAAGPSDVWAVGNNGTDLAAILHWDGQSWSQATLPDLGGPAQLNSVTVHTANDVWAAGTISTNQALILHWDGTQWTQSPTPATPTLTQLQAISSGANGEAWAVGVISAPGATFDPRSLVEHWDGTSWQIVAGPDVSPASLAAVAVSSAGRPWIGGNQDLQTALLAQWNGTGWQVPTSPNPGRAANGLSKVAAAGPNDVWAVGSYVKYYNWTTGPQGVQASLTEHWDGQQWTYVPSPNPTPQNFLDSAFVAVTTVAADDVWAVGNINDGVSGEAGLIGHWDGTAWHNSIDGDLNSTHRITLQAVGAASSQDLWVGGTIDDADTLIQRGDGTTWVRVVTPNVGQIDDLAVAAANDIWATGTTGMLHWNGTQWTQVPSLGGAKALTVVAANDIWAVGGSSIQHWDGAHWTAVTNPAPANSHLLDVSAAGANDIWAVGTLGNFPASVTVALHWDGHTWSILPSPNPGQLGNSLGGVVALSTHEVWAVGTAGNPGASQTLIVNSSGTGFADVHLSDYFYTPVYALASRGAISGYGDCTFRPANNVTRAQLSKLVVVAAGWALTTPRDPHFADVPRDSPFYAYIETAYAHGTVSGYGDGGFHPNALVTRGQASKITVLAAGWVIQAPAQGHFSDVPPGSPFYGVVETAYAHGILSGYGDGTFHPAANVTRGQASKIVYLALTSQEESAAPGAPAEVPVGAGPETGHK